MFKIRRFRNKDTKEVIKVITIGLKQLFKCRKEDLGEELIKNLSDIENNYFKKGGTFFVGEYNGKVIGTVAILPENKKTVRLKRMFLYKKFRGKGFGSKLYNFSELWCKKKGYTKIVLSTYPHFKEAIMMYKYKGFKSLKRTKEQIFLYKNI
jgi:GNAT superfamily N-acetyltransferase